MKLYLIFIVFLLSGLYNYEVEGIRLGKLTISGSNHQEIIKVSSIERSNDQDHEVLAKTDEFPSGINRKLMTKSTSSSTTNTIYKNHNKDGNKNDPKPQIKSAHGVVRNEDNLIFNLFPENANHGKEVANEPYPNDADIVGMDYTPARNKSPIHN